MFERLVQFYEKRYKLLMAITVIMLLAFSGVLIANKVRTGEFIAKDVSLKGGLMITIHTDKELNLQEIEKSLGSELGSSVNIKKMQALGGAGLGYSFTIEEGIDSDKALSAIGKVTGLELGKGSYTIEQVSSGLSSTFWKSTLMAIGAAFLLMSIAVLIFFRLPIPSFAVILCGFSNLIGTLAIMNLIGIKLSVGGVAALLMLLGYSVDTDILLSTRALKRTEKSINERILSSVSTGMTMELTAIAAMTVLWIVSPADMLKQIASILIIGLTLDIPNTWIQNGGIMRWYLEHKEGKK
jgi:preprotein translocase subunit SecF